jgi:hypothetical protein
MRHFGFSTGAIAKDDVLAALSCLRGTEANAIEVSALRLSELDEVIEASPFAEECRFRHRSFHAPSRFAVEDEPVVINRLLALRNRGWRIVVHPDTLHTPQRWRALGNALLVENMDKRKPVGQTARDFDKIFEQLPEAGLCLDLAHARQVDPSMVEAYRLVKRHREKIREVHLSDLNARSAHVPLNLPALEAYREVAALIPRNAPVILETPVECEEVPFQLGLAKLLFLWADITYSQAVRSRWERSLEDVLSQRFSRISSHTAVWHLTFARPEMRLNDFVMRFHDSIPEMRLRSQQMSESFLRGVSENSNRTRAHVMTNT